MCGIIGYTGKKKVKDILLDSLELLEYRGYDSAGVAVIDESSKERTVYKCAGRVADLREKCAGDNMNETCGIGHTRWATHGGVSDANAHPHCYGRVTLVHNGIIENYQELSREYELVGKLISQTDSEIAAGVFDYYYDGNPVECIAKAVSVIRGTYAFVLMFSDKPGVIYSVRNVSPIVAAKTNDGAILASDVTAIGAYTDSYFVVPEYQVLELTKDGLCLFDLDGEEQEIDYIKIDFELNTCGKGNYPFYMEKEINEQPKLIANLIDVMTEDGLPKVSMDGVTDELLSECDRVVIVACGSAMHSGLIGQNMIKKWARVNVSVELASEFMYSDPVLDERTLVIAVSQSGETIDTLEALKYAKRNNAKVISIINVRGSAIARESEAVIYTNAGAEIAVASTKAFTAQITVFYLLALRMALAKNRISKDEAKSIMLEFKKVPQAINDVIDKKDEIHHIAGKILEVKDVFMIGRGIDYATTMEGSLKLKEISYIHSEAYASGELKHGPLALISTETPVIAVATQSHLLSKQVSNIREVKSRGAKVILFAKKQVAESLSEICKVVILPDIEDDFMTLPATVALQLMAYYVSLDKGYDVDKPRNLAKVVTVE